jgi:SAM-dependent methyltransferase
LPESSARGSLSYRKNEAAIRDGRVPEKYLRLLPYITGRTILEIGAAEGVLSLLLAERGHVVTALEMQASRHAAAVDLQARWRGKGRRVDGCTMVCGDIRDNLHLLAGVDTVVAIRTIYHFGDAIGGVFDAMYASGVASVVLAGNPNRARRALIGIGDTFDFLAGVNGMSLVLTTAGYTLGDIVREGDPIVTGHR